MTYDAILSAAIADFEKFGYDSQARVERWSKALEQAAYAQSARSGVDADDMRRKLKSVYSQQVTSGAIFKKHTVSKFTIDKLKPSLRRELDRRLMASANLIKLNRDKMIAETLSRFNGWATSIPEGGSDAVSVRETGATIKKALKQLPFNERRVMIDQGAKFVANLNNIIAVDGGAIAGIWHSRWKAAGYSNYRKEHKERDKKIYVIRDNWAIEKGLIKVDGHQYTDEITACGEEIYCSCTMEYLYNLRDVRDLLTEKGKTYVSE